MHAISSYRGNRPTHPNTHPQTHKHTGPITIHCAAASAQCKYCNRLLNVKSTHQLSSQVQVQHTNDNSNDILNYSNSHHNQWRRQLVGTWARAPWRLREFFC